MGFRETAGERHLQIEWTGGYRAVLLDGGLVVVNPAGTELVRPGAHVLLRGSEIRPGVWQACAPPFAGPGATD
jgi:hypothetical protein